ncbi:hypothetical protein CRUP_006241 [Coryphaenoides rupestris]|nr:hypothetical protein CRUP_006241 [Coryphaenoides rupestris]
MLMKGAELFGPLAPPPPLPHTSTCAVAPPPHQVVFLPGFGCLYVDVVYERGTTVLTLAPEGNTDSLLSLQPRPSDLRLSFHVLVSGGPAPQLGAAGLDSASSASGASSSSWALAPDGSLLVQLALRRAPGGQPAVQPGQLPLPRAAVPGAAVRGGGRGPLERRGQPHLRGPRVLEDFKRSCFLQLGLLLASDGCTLEQVSFHLEPARVYLEDTFVYYIKTLFHSYIPDSAVSSTTTTSTQGTSSSSTEATPLVPAQVVHSVQALVRPVRLRQLTIRPVHLLVSVHASLKLYIASHHTPLSFAVFERGPVCTTARQLSIKNHESPTSPDGEASLERTSEAIGGRQPRSGKKTDGN